MQQSKINEFSAEQPPPMLVVYDLTGENSKMTRGPMRRCLNGPWMTGTRIRPCMGVWDGNI